MLLYFLLLVCISSDVLGQYTLTGSADYAVSGSSFTFTCDTGSAGHSIMWLTPGGNPFTVQQGQGTNCYASNAVPTDYVYTCNRSNYNLTISSVSFSLHGTVWKCDYVFRGSESTPLTLSVHVPLTTTSLTSTPTSVVSGESAVLQCSTNPCYPNATMRWTKNNIEITTGILTTTEFIDGSGVITRSSLTRIYTWSDHGHQIYCSASSDGATKSSYPFLLVVWVRATTVTLQNITSQNKNIGSSEATSVTLTCVTSPSNPIPTVYWYKHGQYINSGITNTTEKTPYGLTVTTSVLLLPVSRSDDGHTVSCRAGIQGQTPVKSNSGILDVWYPPETPILSSDLQGPRLEHHQVALRCYLPSSGHGNPSANFYWMRNGVDIQHTGSTYSFTLTKEDNGAQYTCSAGNLFTDRPHESRPASSSLQLNVYYAPRVKISPDNHTRVELGKLLILRCSADSNPDISKFEWKLGTKHLVDGSVLQIASFRQSDQGEYTCSATAISSSYGSLAGSANVIVTVLEPAPTSCYCTDQSGTSLELVWKYERSDKSTGFTIAQRLSKDTNWISISVLNVQKDDNMYSLHISDLKSNSSYYFKIFSSVNKGNSNFCLTSCRTLMLLREAVSTDGLGLGSGIAIGLVIGIVVASVVAVVIHLVLKRKGCLIQSDVKRAKETDIYQDITMEMVQHASPDASRMPNEPTSGYDSLQPREPTQYEQLHTYNNPASQSEPRYIDITG